MCGVEFWSGLLRWLSCAIATCSFARLFVSRGGCWSFFCFSGIRCANVFDNSIGSIVQEYQVNTAKSEDLFITS